MKHRSLQLMNIGVDVDAVVKRLGGNEDLYLRICYKFITDPNYQLLCQSIDRKDPSSAEFHAHTLKGVAANLGFTCLEHICEKIVNSLRSNTFNTMPGHMKQLEEEYQRIISILLESN